MFKGLNTQDIYSAEDEKNIYERKFANRKIEFYTEEVKKNHLKPFLNNSNRDLCGLDKRNEHGSLNCATVLFCVVYWICLL